MNRTGRMDIMGICAVLAVLFVGVLFPERASAVTRGICVKAVTSTGTMEEIPLYSDYWALVIGCGAYRSGWPFLPNAVKDAREVAKALRGKGWKVRLLEDPDSRTLQKALIRLVAKAGRKKDRAVFVWYSGHGYTIREADGTPLGYIVPVDAPLPGRDLVRFMEKAVSMRRMETVSKGILSRHVLMMFDSCFSGAIFALNRAAPSPYIQEKVAEPVREFITAGNEHETVPDRSIFKTCFLQGISNGYADLNHDGYITGEELGSYLQEKIVNYSHRSQHPQFGKIDNPKLDKGDFVILAGGSTVLYSPSPLGKTCIRIKSIPFGAEVLVQGTFRGVTPLTICNLAPGTYRVNVKKEGYLPGEKDIQVRSSNIVSSTFLLSLNEGSDHEATQQGHRQTKTWAESGTGMEFVWVPGGCYEMGCGDWTNNCNDDEKPVHEVCVDGFWMGKYEVTRGQWKKVMGNHPSYFQSFFQTLFGQGDNYPVEQVSWNDAQEFINKLNRLTGKKFRLPTEAEWEYAARNGGEKIKYSWGNNLGENNANCNGCRSKWDNKSTAPVGSFRPNLLGLYDMCGNVAEWCQDWYNEDYYKKSPRDNPTGPISGLLRVFRGGSWSSGPENVRAAIRFSFPPDYRYGILGFRLVLPENSQESVQ